MGILLVNGTFTYTSILQILNCRILAFREQQFSSVDSRSCIRVLFLGNISFTEYLYMYSYEYSPGILYRVEARVLQYCTCTSNSISVQSIDHIYYRALVIVVENSVSLAF